MNNKTMLRRLITPLVLIASVLAAAPTYTKDVAPILFANCVSCHRPGEIGPMPLLTYEQVRPWAKAIRGAVALGQMPPWHATQEHGVFSNDRRLTDQDRETLVAWVDAGSPEGSPADVPAAPKFTEGWEIGTPDVVLPMQKAYNVPADGTIAYQYFEIPTNFTEDKWVQAIEARPGARAVVHHVLVFCREPGKPTVTPAFHLIEPNMPRLLASSDAMRGPLIATYAPGTNALTFPKGSALKIKAGSILTLQVHYTANGKSTEDVTDVGFIFAKDAPQREMHSGAFYNPTFTLPAGEADKAVDCKIEFTQDSHIWALFPHTHLRGKSWEYRIVYPDGRSEVILSVPKYDFNWQTYYEFATPLAVPKGSRIEATAHYDNSLNNPSNPDPNIDVKWGEQTWQEMQYTGITFTVDEKQGESTVAGQN